MAKRNSYRTDPSQNYMERYPQPLDALFLPQTVAVIGAKDDPGSVGSTILHNLIAGGFKGRLYPVNPKRATVSFPDLGIERTNRPRAWSPGHARAGTRLLPNAC